MKLKQIITQKESDRIFYGCSSEKIENLFQEYYDDFDNLKLLFFDSWNKDFDNLKLLPRLIELCPDSPEEIAQLYWILPKWMTFEKYENSLTAQQIMRTRKWFDVHVWIKKSNEIKQDWQDANNQELYIDTWKKILEII